MRVNYRINGKNNGLASIIALVTTIAIVVIVAKLIPYSQGNMIQKTSTEVKAEIVKVEDTKSIIDRKQRATDKNDTYYEQTITQDITVKYNTDGYYITKTVDDCIVDSTVYMMKPTEEEINTFQKSVEYTDGVDTIIYIKDGNIKYIGNLNNPDAEKTVNSVVFFIAVFFVVMFIVATVNTDKIYK